MAQNKMKRQKRLHEILIQAPWWVSIVAGCFLFGILRWLIPSLLAGNEIGRMFTSVVVPISWYVVVFSGMLGLASFLFSTKRKFLIENEAEIESLKALPWKDFEYLVAEAFQRQGYDVDYNLSSGADGGVDLILQRDGIKTAVQCKRWKTSKVGASVVRELIGAMIDIGADRGIVVTSGSFTADALSLAAANSFELIDGLALVELVRKVQDGGSPKSHPSEESTAGRQPLTPECPKCGSPMVKRRARRGGNVGGEFWGCSRFPKCRGIRQLKTP